MVCFQSIHTCQIVDNKRRAIISINIILLSKINSAIIIIIIINIKKLCIYKVNIIIFLFKNLFTLKKKRKEICFLI
jgi:hypothetical protein